MKGILLVDKPEGMTSHTLVVKVRKIINPPQGKPKYKVGHTGTLDYAATGLMILTVGKATKQTSYFQGLDKVYFAEIELGITTDTYDKQCKVVHTSPVEVEEKKVLDELLSFQGVMEQMPPPYSAKKIGGKKAYQLAKRGMKVSLPKKRITIYSIDKIQIDLPIVRCQIHCSSGTYIRSLAYDLGQKLGCGGYLKSLRRLKIGSYSIEDSYRLEDIEEQGKEGREKLMSFLLPING